MTAIRCKRLPGVRGAFPSDRTIPIWKLAVFEGDWYVSFPPVPSIPQWLLTFFFGSQTPDGLLIKCYALAAMVILYHCLHKRMQWKPWQAALFSGLFALAGRF